MSKPDGETYIIASNREWHGGMANRVSQRCPGQFISVHNSEELEALALEGLNPRYIFFPHWSQKILPSIFENYEAVIFHMTDLPYGRGGSPLQNLIARGQKTTVICAVRCVNEIDAGPIYMKRPLCLHGRAEEIFIRASHIIEDMIVEIVETEPQPIPQQGNPVYFSRRKPDQGNLRGLQTLEQVYDWIRMLDAPGYPPAFLDVGPFRIHFRRASMHYERVRADVEIVRRPEDANDA